MIPKPRDTSPTGMVSIVGRHWPSCCLKTQTRSQPSWLPMNMILRWFRRAAIPGSWVATPDSSGKTILLSLRRMNRIREIDATNMSMTVEAGCVLQTLHEKTEEAGLYFLNLAAKGSCTGGGNLGTNAGGLNVALWNHARANARCRGRVDGRASPSPAERASQGQYRL